MLLIDDIKQGSFTTMFYMFTYQAFWIIAIFENSGRLLSFLKLVLDWCHLRKVCEIEAVSGKW